MKILALDCSATAASCCLMEENRVLGAQFVNIRQTHSQTLMVMVEQLLTLTNTAIQDIDCFAVSAGPGSFTGVRIGVACVKGMAMGTGKPCIGVSTLQAMAMQCIDRTGIVCAVMDARCQQVYNALFDVEDGIAERLCEDRAISITDLAEELKQYHKPIYLIGDGAELCANTPQFRELSNVVLLSEPNRQQQASGVALCASSQISQAETLETASQLRPTYLRIPQAEREQQQKLAMKENTV